MSCLWKSETWPFGTALVRTSRVTLDKPPNLVEAHVTREWSEEEFVQVGCQGQVRPRSCAGSVGPGSVMVAFL